MHAEGTSRALREDAFGKVTWLGSKFIFLIRSSYLLNKLINTVFPSVESYFNGMIHKIVSVTEIFCVAKDSSVNRIPFFKCYIVNINFHHVFNHA